MRYLLVLNILLLISCSRDSEVARGFDPEAFPQKWELVKMTGNFQGSISTGDKMSWQENYIFNIDGTFVRIRETSGVQTEGKGTYLKTKISNENYFVLTYKEGNLNAGTCSSDGIEYLYEISNSVLHNTWAACDGPGLEYKRTE